MDFRIADTFLDSLARLSNEEQKAVKTTAFDLQTNPAQPGLQFHKLEKAKDSRFASVRVSSDVRLIVHRTPESLLLCYVGHHDKAYQWAERRKLEIHPKTGAAQIVEVRETVQEILIPTYVDAPRPAKPKLFAKLSKDELLNYGVPPEWLNDVLGADEDSLLTLADHLPGEAAEALLEIATGGRPVVLPPPAPSPGISPTPDIPHVAPENFPFEHPDAQRRFRLIVSDKDLERALEFPWEKWTVFLHPTQRELVEKEYNGPARVSGSAGTGKTIVALHRAVILARRHPDARVLLTTFSDTLANALHAKLKRLIGNEPRIAERLEVHAIEAIGRRLYESHLGQPKIASRVVVASLLAEATKTGERSKFSSHFLMTEWEEVVDAWQVDSWEAYRDVRRLGRKTRLSEPQRKLLWDIFASVRAGLKRQALMTIPEMFSRLAAQLVDRKSPAFDFAVVDEAQDIGVSQLRFLAALGAGRPNSLFFAGDLGQRIFQAPFSWRALGVDVRGRSNTLHINYRTSHQIRAQADRLLGPELADVDGNTETRMGTISVFNGPIPTIRVLGSPEEEAESVGNWLRDRSKEGVNPHEIGIFIRSTVQLDRARTAAEVAGLPFKVLDERVETTSGYASVCTMHLAKGLEFKAVVVMACDDEIVPLQDRIESVSDDSDLEEIYNTERHLLYVACTRAREHLLVTGVEPGSEFLDDLKL